MAFGQSAGPPATARQLTELQALLADAGHVDFRDARGPMGFNQRQAGGRFTRDEADEFIAQLHAAAEAIDAGEDVPRLPPQPRVSGREAMLRKIPAQELAAELQRRGWIVMEA